MNVTVTDATNTVEVVGPQQVVVTAAAAQVVVEDAGAQGPTGPPGPTGATGPAGPGVAIGGTEGQVLVKDSATDYDTSWGSLTQSTVRAFPTLSLVMEPSVNDGYGRWPQYSVADAGAFTLNQLRCHLMPIPHAVTIDQVVIYVTTGEASATPRLGLYEVGPGGTVGDLIVDAGTVDGSTNGVKTITLGTPVDVVAGAVWFAMVPQGASSTLRIRRYGRPATFAGPYTIWDSVSNVATSTNATTLWFQNSVTGSLPADGSSMSRGTADAAQTIVRVSALL